MSKTSLEASYEALVGSEDNINLDFVKNHMELLYFYPIKNEKSAKSKEEALAQYLKTMGTVLGRFKREDTLGRITSVTGYIRCLDQASIDVAAADGLSEADFRALVHE